MQCGGDVIGKGSFGCIVRVHKTRKESYVYKLITLVRNQQDLRKQITALSISKQEFAKMGISHLLSESAETIKEIDNSRILLYELAKPDNRQYRRYFALIEGREDVIFEDDGTLRNRGLKPQNINICRTYFIERVSTILQRAAQLKLDINLDIGLLKMRHIQGINLREYIHDSDKNRTMLRNHPEKFVAICYQTIRALAFMHKCRIIHRDIKSENIMIDQIQNCPVYIDFGFSRHLTENSVISVNDYRYGTPIFKPPESVIMYSNMSKTMLPILLHQLYRENATILRQWDPIHTYTYAYIESTMNRILKQFQKSPESVLSIENLMKFDVFSLGCTLYENFTEIYPYEEYRTHPWAVTLNTLLIQMMNPDVFNRITAETAKNEMFNHRAIFPSSRKSVRRNSKQQPTVEHAK